MCDSYLIGQRYITDKSNFAYIKEENGSFKLFHENCSGNGNGTDTIEISFCPWCGKN